MESLSSAFSRILPRDIRADILLRYAHSVREDELYEGFKCAKREQVPRGPIEARDWANITTDAPYGSISLERIHDYSVGRQDSI
ncbi:hypothetical protein SISSUDRAFT_1055520 [Sistotremastrum suecicum HHB10207 ss-3]|uniref:Uncharacterized protein n=1 Tax=Sistotremastrum suecicum HHB10207 ss-3 TaxID=1314776 RepID=A0A165XQW4_9AGAM|nr:hypothetical protein SISSUDRAFT_1055520 [Sistotremastrum suecicum HHB10207 ss-3]